MRLSWIHGRSLIYSTSKNQMRVFGWRRKLSLSIFKGTPCHSWVSTWTHLSPWFGSLPSCLLGWISCLEGESLWNSKANLVFRGTPYGVNTPSRNKYLRHCKGELVNLSLPPFKITHMTKHWVLTNCFEIFLNIQLRLMSFVFGYVCELRQL